MGEREEQRTEVEMVEEEKGRGIEGRERGERDMDIDMDRVHLGSRSPTTSKQNFCVKTPQSAGRKPTTLRGGVKCDSCFLIHTTYEISHVHGQE